MKKLIALLLTMVMLIGLMAGCASSAPSNTQSSPTSSPSSSNDSVSSETTPDDNTDTPYEYQKITLGWGTSSAEGTIVVDAMTEFAEKIAEATNGNVKIDLYPGSQLGSTAAMMEQTQLGTLAMVNLQPSGLNDIGVEKIMALSMPYLFTSFDQRWDVLYGEIGSELLGYVDQANVGLHGFSYYGDGARHFFTTFPVHSLQDIAGHKIRVADNSLDNAWCGALGCIVTPTATSEMYSAMSTGLVEGCEQPIAAYYSSRYFEVSDYLILDGHTYNTIVIAFSQKVWDTLEPELQTLLNDTWSEVIQAKKSVITSTEEEYLKQIAEEGVEVIELDDLDAWAAAMDGVYAEFGADFQEYIARIKEVA